MLRRKKFFRQAGEEEEERLNGGEGLLGCRFSFFFCGGCRSFGNGG